jgi:hypothetical protein
MDEVEAHVREMIRASDIPAEVATALQDSLRYSIRLHTTLANDGQLALGATKIGGQPDLPQDLPWPEWHGAPFDFLAQIRLSDIAAYDPDGELPHEGMLSFFFDYTNWGKPGREEGGPLATVLYIPVDTPLERQSWPETLPMRERYAPLAVTSFSREVTAPDFESPIIERFGYTLNSLYPPDDMSEHAVTARRIEDVVLGIDTYLHEMQDSRGLVHRLLGYGDGIQGSVESSWHWLAGQITATKPELPAFSAIQATDWLLLLQVDSDVNGMTWGDVGRIYYGLPRQALAARDFSLVLAELQCT